MTVYIVALMALLNGQLQGVAPPMAYVFTEPTFTSVEECKRYATINGTTILLKLYEEFGNDYKPHMVSCVDQDEVKQLQKEALTEKELET